MKNRDYKQFAAGHYYHIYNRGNGKMIIFRDDQDYFNFLKRASILLRVALIAIPFDSQSRLRLTSLPPNALHVSSYCLMPNHFHFAILQNSETSISVFIHRLCTSYTKYFNKKYGRVGSLFQDQFKSVLVESEEQLLWLSEYIYRNPERAGLIKDAAYYKWNYCVKGHL